MAIRSSEWKRNGRPAANGWNRSTNNARFGTDCFNRTGTAKSNMFDNKPTETQYRGESAGASLDGWHGYGSPSAASSSREIVGAVIAALQAQLAIAGKLTAQQKLH